jgi:hypothetical protein
VTTSNQKILSRVGVTYKTGFGFDDSIYCTLYIHSLGLREIQRYRYSTHIQFTVTHALHFSVFTSRILATDLSQSHCHFKSHMKSSRYSLIPFLPLSCSFQIRRLDSRLLFSTRSRLLTMSLHNPSARTTQKTQPLLLRRRFYWSFTYLLLHAYASRECIYPVVA